MRTHVVSPRTAAALAVALGLAAGARAETLPLDLEVGYRFASISGDKEMYRSQLNERAGFLLRSMTFTPDFTGKDSFLDSFRLDASDLGVGPTGSVRLEAGKSHLWRLRATYLRQELFNLYPAFANPFLEQGIVPGQHSLNRKRNMVDVDLEIFPNCAITPVIGYSWNRYDGPAQTTYHVGQDEFRLTDNLRSTEQEVRFGASFDFGPVTGQVIQGWRKTHEIETLVLAPGEGAGNDPGTVLGKPITLTSFGRDSASDVNTPVTTAAVALRAAKDLKFTATYVRASASGDTSDKETLSGSLVSFDLARFFGALADTTTSGARNTNYRWTVRGEFTIVDGVDLSGGWLRRHNKVDGLALISSLYSSTSTFGGASAADLQAILQAQTGVERTEDLLDARLTWRALGPVSLSVGYTTTNQDLTVSPDPSEIVVPGSQGGTFARTIGQIDGRATFTIKGFSLVGMVSSASANRAVVRTDFVDRDTYKLRATLTPISWITLGASAERVVDKNNPFVYNSKSTRLAGDVEVRPWKPLSLRFSAGSFKAASSIPIRIPWNFATDVSTNNEDGHSYEGGLSFAYSRFTLDGSYGSFSNDGTFPFSLDRARARLEVDVIKGFAAVFEYDRDKYQEKLASVLPYGNYEANRYGFYVRIKP
jgi:hypothetical protein